VEDCNELGTAGILPLTPSTFGLLQKHYLCFWSVLQQKSISKMKSGQKKLYGEG